jgi:hypothetical protein
MSRPPLSISTFAPILAVALAVTALALIAFSRPQVPPRFLELAQLGGVVRARSGASVTLRTPRGERAVDVSACTAYVPDVKAGDMLTVWVDTSLRAWKIMRGTTPLCSYVDATQADMAARHRRRLAAVVVAIASVACAALTAVSWRARDTLSEPPPRKDSPP